MKLAEALDIRPSEIAVASRRLIVEEGEGPRWGFHYPRFRVDPSPDILLLGGFRHPSSGNNLVAGINLHYLNAQQRNRLAKALPAIMKTSNLYDRYWVGRRLVPDVFKNFYRTYRQDYIGHVKKDVMYPKLGMATATKNWVKQKLANIFRTKQQRQAAQMPQYPDDISQFQKRLDTAVQQRGGQPAVPVGGPVPQPETPEIQAARDAFLRLRQQQQLQHQQDPGLTPQQLNQLGDVSDLQVMQARQAEQEPPEPAPPPEPNPHAEQEEQLRRAGERLDDDRLENQRELEDEDELQERRYRRTGVLLREAVARQPTRLGYKLMQLAPLMATAAQEIYDEATGDEDSGGLCDMISGAIMDILAQHDIECHEGGHEGDDHSWVLAYDDDGVYAVDIPPDVYEHGGGYSWQLYPDVVFTLDDVAINFISGLTRYDVGE